MSVVIETTVGDFTVDLFLEERPRACLNFLKLCKLKYYNFNLFHTIEHGFIAQTGDPSGTGDGGESVWGVLEGSGKRFFKAEHQPKIRHSDPGLLSMVSLGENLIGSQFFLTLGTDLTSLDGQHCVIGQVTEGLEILRYLNDAICDNTHRPYQDIRITHTVILDDPFENPRGFKAPSRSPSPSADRMQGGRIGADENIDDTEGKTEQEIQEMLQEREAKARATILEIVGDLPDADVAPPENVLFVCKLNPVTCDDDLEIIFSRFGKVKGCEVIRDRTTGDSLQYAFVEFQDSKACENAYFKMDNVLIDDRRIHVDFSQSVAKVQWKGKGRGLVWKDGNKTDHLNFNNLKGHTKPEVDKNKRGTFPVRRPNRGGTPKRRTSRSPNSIRDRDNLNERRSRNESRDRGECLKRLRSSKSPNTSDHRRRIAPRSRSRDRRTYTNIRFDRNRSGDGHNEFRSHYERHPRHNDQRDNRRNYSHSHRELADNQRRGSDRLIPSGKRKSVSPIITTKYSTKDRSAKVNRSNSDSDSSPVRKKSKKSKRKKKKSKKSKKSKKVSSSSSSDSSSSS